MIDMTQAPYSCDPAGKRDVGAAITRAVNDHRGTRPLHFPAGTYRRDVAASCGYPLSIVGDGPGMTVFLSNPRTIFAQAIGSNSGPYTPTADLPAGTPTLSLASVSGLEAGDWLNIRSQRIWRGSGPDGSDKHGRYGELARVHAVNGRTSTVTLTGPTSFGYALADTVTIDRQRMLPNGLTLAGFTVRNPSPNTGGSASFVTKRVTGVRIQDVEFERTDGPCIQGYLTAGLSARGVTFRDLSEQHRTGRYGYGFDMRDASRDWHITDCHMDGGRHLFTTNAYGKGAPCYGIPQYATVSNSTGTGMYEAPFDTHEEGADITFVGCWAHNSRAFAFQVRSPRTTLIDCGASDMGAGAIIRSTAAGVVVRGFTAHNMRAGTTGHPHAVQVESGCSPVDIAGVAGDAVDGDLIHIG